MTTPHYTEAAGAADSFAVWPPPSWGMFPPMRGQLAVLMRALIALKQQTMSGPLPNVPVGGLFWADSTDVAALLANGQATLAPPGATLPPEPRYTVERVPGLAAGTSNASH